MLVVVLVEDLQDLAQRIIQVQQVVVTQLQELPILVEVVAVLTRVVLGPILLKVVLVDQVLL